MINPLVSAGYRERYLRLLGTRERDPGYDALVELVAAQLQRVPFENISKLYHRKQSGLRGLPSLELYLDDIERHNFGGTCYANNYYLYLLLEALGYDVDLCGADMSDSDVHVVSIVSLEGREYLVDAGYAAPFLSPLPRDLSCDHVISLGRNRYVLKPQDAQGNSRLELYRDDKLTHGYTAKPIPRAIDHFEGVIEASYADSATFMNAVLIVRFFEDRSVAVSNYELIESSGNESVVTRLAGPGGLLAAAEERFGMPRALVEVAISDLELGGDAWT